MSEKGWNIAYKVKGEKRERKTRYWAYNKEDLRKVELAIKRDVEKLRELRYYKRRFQVYYYQHGRPKILGRPIPSQHARKRARIVGSVGLKQTRKVRERGY